MYSIEVSDARAGGIEDIIEEAGAGGIAGDIACDDQAVAGLGAETPVGDVTGIDQVAPADRTAQAASGRIFG